MILGTKIEVYTGFLFWKLWFLKKLRFLKSWFCKIAFLEVMIFAIIAILKIMIFAKIAILKIVIFAKNWYFGNHDICKKLWLINSWFWKKNHYFFAKIEILEIKILQKLRWNHDFRKNCDFGNVSIDRKSNFYRIVILEIHILQKSELPNGDF